MSDRKLDVVSPVHWAQDADVRQETRRRLTRALAKIYITVFPGILFFFPEFFLFLQVYKSFYSIFGHVTGPRLAMLPA